MGTFSGDHREIRVGSGPRRTAALAPARDVNRRSDYEHDCRNGLFARVRQSSALVRLPREDDPIMRMGLQFTIVSAISDVIHRLLLLLLPALLLSGALRS